MLKILKKEEALAVAENTKIPEDTNDESSSCQDSMKLLSDLTNSKISIQGSTVLKASKYRFAHKCTKMCR